MSARKKVNQSRPRALARAATSRVAGAVCFDTADDAKLPPTRRSSRPPSNSSANADSSMSPAPSGITASVLAECPVQSATPLYLSPPRRVGSFPTKGGGRACHLSPFTSATPRHAEQRVAAVLVTYLHLPPPRRVMPNNGWRPCSRASQSAQRRQF